jgi:hypothetical protein
MARLRQTVKGYDIHFWLDSFLEAAFEGRARPCPRSGFATFMPKIKGMGAFPSR